jgi:hypothetical protein
MQWWNDFVGWLYSDEGWRVISTVVAPFLAIVVAGLVAAGIGRASTSRVLTLNERQQRAAAVTAMIGAARRAAVWNTLSDSEQRHADHSALESDVRLRLLSVTGAGLASDWCAHEIAMMKKNAVSFSFQAEQSMLEFRNRLIDWHAKPSRAKKLFKNDLDSWAYDTSLADHDLVAQQQAWAAQQSASQAEPATRPSAETDTPSVQPAGAPRTSFAPASTPTARAVSGPVETPGSAFGSAATGPTLTATRPFQRPNESATEAHDDGANDVEPAQPQDDSGADEDESENSEFPPPVSVSHVRERINPTLSERDELR